MKFTKKPVTIDAWKIENLLHAAANDWKGLPDSVKESYEKGDIIFADGEIHIKTLEGTMIGGVQDYLIQGIKGEFYPCKPDIFVGSYSPADEESLQTQFLNFGNALDLVKKGLLLARSGWNGKSQFIFMRPADELTPKFIYETVKSLPKSLKNFVHNKFKGETHYVGGDEIKVKFTPYLCLFNAQGDVVNGWVPSQGDLMAEDWEVVIVK